MILRKILSVAFGIWFAAGCAMTNPGPKKPEGLTTREIVALYPADNAGMQRLLNQTLLAGGTQTLTEICEMLGDTISVIRTGAEYAISGIVLEAEPGQYNVIEKAVTDALTCTLQVEDKRFLLEQLRVCGSDAAAGPVAAFLDDPLLSETAVQTLSEIRTAGCAEILMKRYASAPVSLKISILRNLARMHYQPAAPELLKIAGDAEGDLRLTSMEALAELGYPPAADMLRSNMDSAESEQKDLAATLYLKFLGQTDRTDLRLEEARRIMNDRTLPGHIRLQAIRLCLETAGSSMIPEIYDILTTEEESFRTDVYLLLIPWKDPQARSFWLEKLGKEKPDRRTEIIRFLGLWSDPDMVLVLLPFLEAADKWVRIEAMRSITRLDPIASAEPLLNRLSAAADPDEQEVVIKCLMFVPADSLNRKLPAIWETGDQDVRIMIIRLIAARESDSMNSVFMNTLSGADSSMKSEILGVLQNSADMPDFQPLLAYGLNEPVEGLKGRTAKVLIAVRRRAESSTEADSLIRNAFRAENDCNLIWLLDVMRYSEDPAVLEDASSMLGNPSPRIRQAAFRALTGWQSPVAIDTLAGIAIRAKDSRNRILALQGALRLIRESVADTTRRIGYYQTLLSAADRDEERRMIISGIGETGDLRAVRLLTPYLRDPEIGEEAEAALERILSSQAESNPGLMGVLHDLMPEIFNETESLTAPPKGFTALFENGDLNRWRGRFADPPEEAEADGLQKFKMQMKADSLMEVHWIFRDGVLTFDGEGKNICTRKNYRNFELLMDWKIGPGGDSGIYLRGIPQVQIWDIREHPEGSGGLYNNKNSRNTPLLPADKPAGEWNHFRILMLTSRVTVFLNDRLVADNLELENYWEPGTPVPGSGSIELQAHHSRISFRNIYVRELPDTSQPAAVPLINPGSLTGWKIIGGKPDSWSATDSILAARPDGSGWLSTSGTYSDFELDLDFNVPPGGNSGVFLRAPHEGDPAYSGIEIQILDDFAEKYRDLQPWQYTGSVYGLSAPAVRVARPAGEWQHIKILCEGPHLQVVLNDRIINDVDLIDYMYREPDHPGLKRRAGYIGLQNHGSGVAFKNIVVKERFGKEP